MKNSIKVDKNKTIDKVSNHIFGALVEHVGRSVYNGIYEPGHVSADKNGFRRDVIDCAKEMGVTCVRYPGGNFVSGYDWKDGIGPKENRLTKLNLAWRELEPNYFGTDEMIRWADKISAEVIMAVNMGTGTVNNAAELVEYCNFANGTFWSEKRIANGNKDPYNVQYWCVGNEMDGGYQLGALSAEEYAKKAREAAKQMKIVDDNSQFIFCGSSSPVSPFFPDWDRTVLKIAYDYIDFLSIHAYYDYISERNINDFLASPVGFERHIENVVLLCDAIKEELSSEKTVMLAVDEWNVWHTCVGEKHNHPWSVGESLIENNYDFADALVVAGMLSVLVNHCDRVKIGCIAQLVNVIAPIMTQPGGDILKQTTFYPFALFSKCKDSVALIQETDSDMYNVSAYGKSLYLYSSICYNETTGEYICYLINTANEECDLTIDFGESVQAQKHVFLHAELNDKNTFENKEKVVAKERNTARTKSAVQCVVLDGYSFNVIWFRACNAGLK